MLEYGNLFADDAAKVAFIGDFLERDAADWYVGLFDYEAPELLNYDAFITALCNQFEDPLVGTMARKQLQRLQHGEKTVSGYAD